MLCLFALARPRAPGTTDPAPALSLCLLQSVTRVGSASAALSASGMGYGLKGAAGAHVRVALGLPHAATPLRGLPVS